MERLLSETTNMAGMGFEDSTHFDGTALHKRQLLQPDVSNFVTA
jgi:hypothetical protein